MDSNGFRTALDAATSFLDTPVVTVSVGSEVGNTKDFSIHEGLLKDHSAFFNNALNPNRFKEGFERRISMPGDDSKVFALYVQLLYRPDLLSTEIKRNSELSEQECILLAELYVFVEMIMDESTKNILLEAFKIFSWERPFPVAVAQIIYEGAPEHDPARAIFVQSFFRYGQQQSLESIHDTGHPDLLRDIAFSLSKRCHKVHDKVKTGNWTTTHGRIPNVVPGVGEVELKECENEEDYEEDQDSIEQDNEDGKRDDESDELEDTGKGGWSPRLESITEEI
ncbi:unnamed protein product [Alternaria alternata]